MKMKTLQEIPPWDWPEGTDKDILAVLSEGKATPSERLLAAELAGDFTVINDDLVAALLAILRNGEEPEDMRATAAIALGPVLEQGDVEGFDDPDEVPIAERTFNEILASLHKLYVDAKVPGEVRRRILEASVRAPQDWHEGAVRAAYGGNGQAWTLTAVFCMRFIRGFEEQILEALESEDPEIHGEAVLAAGNWEVKAAWPHVAALLTSDETDKPLLLAAIEAAGNIRPSEAAELFAELMDSDDEDIVEAVHDAMAMSGIMWDEDDEDF